METGSVKRVVALVDDPGREDLYDVGTDLSLATRYDKMAEAMGGHGERVTEPGEIQPAIRRALDSGRPAVVDVVLDPKGLADEASTRELAI